MLHSPPTLSGGHAVIPFLRKRWFLLTLVVVMAIGISLCDRLEPVSKMKPVRNGLVATVLFLMALPLEASAMWQALRRPWPPLLAVMVNLGLLPLFAWALSKGLNEDLGAGLLVAAVTPCTLASASVWTRRAGGNDAVSILVTIITNSICFLVTPVWLYLMIGAAADNPVLKQALDPSRMIPRLALIVVLPMAAAQLLRLHRPFAAWATQQKPVTSIFAQCGILSMVMLGAIGVGLRLRDSATLDLLDVIAMLVVVCVVHVTMLWTGVRIAKILRFTREDQIAVAFAGSQKTLTVGLLVAMSLQVSILPMVWYHVSQLFIDTLFADRYRREAEETAESD